MGEEGDILYNFQISINLGYRIAYKADEFTLLKKAKETNRPFPYFEDLFHTNFSREHFALFRIYINKI